MMEENKNPNKDMLNKMKDKLEGYYKMASDKITGVVNENTINDVTSQVENMINDASSKVQDGMKNVNIENALKLALKAPGAKIDRAEFLKFVLEEEYNEEMIEMAIENNPAYVGIDKEKIDRIAKEIIDTETKSVSMISASTSVIGGSVLAATVDLSQYLVFVLRVMQKLAYIYGFKEFDLNEENEDTMNLIMVFLGVMFNVEGADKGLNLIAQYEAKNVAKDVAEKSMAKGAIYPIVKEVIQIVSVKFTKQVFADSIVSLVPLMGALASGTITYATFKPCAIRLQSVLKDCALSNPSSFEHE